MTFWCENYDKGAAPCRATFYSPERQANREARDSGWRFKFEPLAPMAHRKIRVAYCPECKGPKA
jgi:hypothetical protein